jgi:hypothetical protein
MVFSPVEKTLFVRPHRDSAYVWDHFIILLSVEILSKKLSKTTGGIIDRWLKARKKIA